MKPLIQDEAYRIGRELLRNAFHHADTSEIEAAIRYEDRLFCLRIRDNGKGIDPKILKAGSRTGHWGLTGMRELSARELDVLRLIAAGNANKEIAAQLSVTEETVKSHVTSILSKLAANDRTHAVTIALKRGISKFTEVAIPRKWERRVTVSKVSIPFRISYAESGIVQRIFSTFADGWPGGGLLAQRLLAGGALVYCGVTCATANPLCATLVPESIGAVAGAMLIAGLWTPIAGLVVAILETRLALLSPAHAVLPLFLAVLGATLAMIGPGTWSVDAWLFGRKRIVPPDL
jgi:putative oxidoreductase